jgi:hypothetical protein
MMNERIKELAEQANIEFTYDVTETPTRAFAECWEDELEKFAELIVRECARAVDKVYEDAEPDHGCYDWATWAEGADVLKHFGIEE